MPKEITHWLIAQQVGNSLQGTPAGDAAKAFPNCLLLGAILHDAPYFTRVQRWKETMSVIADAIHGKGHDILALIESVASTSAKRDKSGSSLAVLVGMISHIAADSCFHPLIIHETGNCDDPDRARRSRAVQLHRRFETILDVYLAGTLENIRTFSLKNIMRKCERPVPALLLSTFMQTADDFDFPKLPEAMLYSLKNFARMQSLYANPVMTRLMQALYPCLLPRMREIASLFYQPRFVKMAPQLHDLWTIPDPENEGQRDITIRGLYNDAVQLAIDLCGKLEPLYTRQPPTAYPPPTTSAEPVSYADFGDEDTGNA